MGFWGSFPQPFGCTLASTVASATMELHEEIGAVRRETELDAPREDVWALVAEPEGLATWLADEVSLDAIEPGARGTVTEHGEERHVTIEEVEPGRRVALSWCTPGGEPSLVELTLDDVVSEDDDERRTRMVVVEIPLVTLRVASSPATIRAAGGAAGPQMALAHA
jgi:uncharacterized protein YndB with AHSA1/START domain